MERQGFRLVKCVYDVAIHQEVMRELVAWGGQFVRPPYGDDAIAQVACDRVIERFSLVGPVLKHPSFSEEREWRLVRHWRAEDRTRTKFRIGKSTLIPYFEFALAPDTESPMTFSKVYLGPTPSMKLSTGGMCPEFCGKGKAA
jgi:hypothetical protein